MVIKDEPDLSFWQRLNQNKWLGEKWKSLRSFIKRYSWSLSPWLPKGLYARTILIIATPLVLLQTVLLFVFMERHWNNITRRLSAATARDVAAIIEIYNRYPQDKDHQKLIEIARDKMSLSFQVLPKSKLPKTTARPFYSILDRRLTKELRKRISYPIWVDTVGQSKFVEIRIALDKSTLKFLAHRNHTYASNSHIFVIWMIGSSTVLLGIALLFLRNQIRPILQLSDAAESFGKGRPLPENFSPRGAREVRQASLAFMEMRDRINRHVDQRTTILAGVSHDLRTILTRMKLQLAFLDDEEEVRALQKDIDEMQSMLEDYMAFAKGDNAEETSQEDVGEILNEIYTHTKLSKGNINLRVLPKSILLPLRRNSFKRAINNLVTNSMRYADTININASKGRKWLIITIDDDGPGIPKDKREEVFNAFLRLDDSRNQNQGNTGLGLSIARDIIRGHGGDIRLEESALGGLRAKVRVPI